MKIPDKLKWSVDKDYICNSEYCSYWEGTKEHAQYIVHACNNYPKLKEERDELIEVLGDLLNSYSGKAKVCGHDFYCVCPSERAKELLNRIKT